MPFTIINATGDVVKVVLLLQYKLEDNGEQLLCHLGPQYMVDAGQASTTITPGFNNIVCLLWVGDLGGLVRGKGKRRREVERERG